MLHEKIKIAHTNLIIRVKLTEKKSLEPLQHVLNNEDLFPRLDEAPTGYGKDFLGRAEFACAGNGIPCRRQKRDRCIEFGGVASDYKDANVLVEELRRGGEETQRQQQQQQGRINARSRKGW